MRIAAIALTCLTTAVLLSTASAGQHAAPTKATAASAPLTDGEVRKIDKDAGKITIKHGPLENLGMPAMTMVYRVKDPAMLDKLKIGDKISFTADKVNGTYTVTQIKPAR
ncbi:MAG TPA: copper-binding protein [Burkholderiales bacterium]|nr:copper-binding protein [Burkholderiales bacterium]